jgi:hypothetical protein
MVINNDGSTTIYNGLTVGSGSNTPLIINAPTTIGTANDNRNLIIYGNLSVFGNIKCTGTLEVNNLVVNNACQLPQVQEDIEFGAWFNQLETTFDNIINGRI